MLIFNEKFNALMSGYAVTGSYTSARSVNFVYCTQKSSQSQYEKI